VTLSTVSVIGIAMILAPCAALAEDVPDAFSVKWQGQHLYQKLYEDAQIRVGRCTFPPGAVHACHSHPAVLVYTLSGGKGQERDARGTRQFEAKTGEFSSNAPTPWHELKNIGDTTITYLIIEKKYEPVAAVDQQVCKQ
jgi:beta-alanine degradation protein BauB